MNIKLIAIVFMLSTLCACASSPDITGPWIDTRQPEPPITKQGIYFKKDGNALSINGQTKAYKTWQLKGKQLTLIGKQAQADNITDFTEIYKIKKFHNDYMTLEKDGKKIHYIKDDSVNYKINN